VGKEKKSFINYRASAGSGKTYQLVLEYLALALKKEDNFKHILAITFTNKAAAEMKERILRSLKELSKGDNEELKKNLLKKTPSLTNIEQQAGRVLKKVLHNYSGFAVTTIDSFINRLVRAFTYETDIPAGFDVELNLTRMDNHIVRNLLADIGVDSDTTRLILEFVMDRINRNISWRLEPGIRPLLSELSRERQESPLEKLSESDPGTFLKTADRIRESLSNFMEDIVSAASKGADIIAASGVPFHQYANKGKGAAAYMVKVSRLSKYQIKKFLNIGDVNFRKGAWTTQKMDPELREKIEAATPELDRVHHIITGIKDEREKKIRTLYYVFENIFLLGLIGKITRYLTQYKSEYNVVPIHDLTKNVHRIIRKGDIPFIYYILGDSFEHIMIDEFQDTSRMQWDSLFPLIENSVSENNVSLGVGDTKQSIYRWRGGETDIMDRIIHEQFLPWGGVEQEDLPFNFRSAANIVEFNNRIFGDIQHSGGPNGFLTRIYRGTAQKVKAPGQGFVSVTLIPRDEAAGSMSRRVETAVRRCIDAGYSPSDIAVLTRKKVPGMEIADHLISKGIRIVTPELLLLHRNPTALFLINLLKFTDDNTLDHVLADILFYLSEYFKGEIWDVPSTDLYFKEKEESILPECVRKFFSLRQYLLRLPLYETVEELIRIFKLNSALKISSSGFITAFLDMILEFTSKESGNISGFLKWWEEYGTEFSATTPENGNGVTIMTIHKAKGLEFPVVIIPGSDWKEKSGGSLWLNPDSGDLGISGYDPPYLVKGVSGLEKTFFASGLEEEQFRRELDSLNLFYVATTRAKESLFIFSTEEILKKGKHKNYRLLQEISGSGFFDSEEGGTFEKGTLARIKHPEKKENVEVLKDESLISTGWSGKITIRERSEKFWQLTPEDQLKKIDRGIIIHEILSEVENKDSIANLLQRMEFSGRIDKKGREEIGNILTEMFRSPEVPDWFFGEGEHLMEQPILWREGSSRPDRIIISDDSVKIIDFKTGRESDSDVEQMRGYKSLVSSMGYSTVRGILYYLQTGNIKEV